MKIAVSACLLGEKVRYDGGHKHQHYITGMLGRYAQFAPFCPEDAVFGTPRPSMRLVKEAGVISARLNRGGENVTAALEEGVAHELKRLDEEPLCGVIFKARSPSCGLESAKTYLLNGHSEGKRSGFFAAAMRERYPLLPMEDEGRLQDAWLRENFVMQLFAFDAFETFRAGARTMGDLVAFHTSYKYLLLAKDEPLYRQMGKLVGNHDALAFEALLERYELLFKTAIAKKSSIRRTRNVLDHMAGFFKRHLDAREKAMLQMQIEDYVKKIVPLIVPLSTIELFAHKYEVAFLLTQRYLQPYPKELALRSVIGESR